jgi:hypothetical protein
MKKFEVNLLFKMPTLQTQGQKAEKKTKPFTFTGNLFVVDLHFEYKFS